MKFINLFLTFVLTVNATVTYAGPKQDAEVAIAQSQAAANLVAETLLREDLDKLVSSIVSNSVTKISPETHPLPARIEELNRKVLAQLNQNPSVQTMDLAALSELVQNYRALVRERFAASFAAQDLIYDRSLTLRSFELPFEGFDALCKTGRSAVGSILDSGKLPRIPPNQYSVSFYYGGKDGESKVQASSVSPNEDSKNRNAVGGALGIATGITGSIALTGAAGATTTMAIAVAPYLAAAFVAYSLINYAITNDEGLALQNEQAQAAVDVFMKSANDRDIARHYQTHCAKAAEKIAPLRTLIHDFYQSDVRRLEIQAEIDRTLPEQQAYFEATEKRFPDRQLLAAAAEKQKQCQTATPNDACKPASADQAAIDAALARLRQHNATYPQEKVIVYEAYKVIALIQDQWQAMSAVLQNASFIEVDRAMNLLARKLQVYVVEVQKIRNSKWAKSNQLIGAEQKLQDEFFALRQEYFTAVSMALKIYFNKADAKKGKEAFRSFIKRFQAFAAKTIVNPDVQLMNQSVKTMEAFYETL